MLVFKCSGPDTIKKLFSVASAQEKSANLKSYNLHNVNKDPSKSVKAAAEKKKTEYVLNLPT